MLIRFITVIVIFSSIIFPPYLVGLLFIHLLKLYPSHSKVMETDFHNGVFDAYFSGLLIIVILGALFLIIKFIVFDYIINDDI